MTPTYITNATNEAHGVSAKGTPPTLTIISTLANFKIALTTPIKAPPAMKPEAMSVFRQAHVFVVHFFHINKIIFCLDKYNKSQQTTDNGRQFFLIRNEDLWFSGFYVFKI